MKTTLITSLSLVGVLGAGTAAALVNTSIFDSAPQNEAAAFVPGAELVQLTLPEPVVMAAADTTADPVVTAATTPTPATLTTAAQAPVTPSASLAVTANENPSQDNTPATTAAEASDSTVPSDSTPATTAPATTTPATTTPATTTPPPTAPSMLTTYDLGGAGSVTVDVISGRMTLVDATAAAGWTVSDADIDALTNEVEVELTDGSMIVDFTVGLVDGALVPDIRTEEVANGGYDDEYEDHDDDDDDHDDDDEYEEDDDDDDDEDDD